MKFPAVRLPLPRPSSSAPPGRAECGKNPRRLRLPGRATADEAPAGPRTNPASLRVDEHGQFVGPGPGGRAVASALLFAAGGPGLVRTQCPNCPVKGLRWGVLKDASRLTHPLLSSVERKSRWDLEHVKGALVPEDKMHLLPLYDQSQKSLSPARKPPNLLRCPRSSGPSGGGSMTVSDTSGGVRACLSRPR